MPEVEQLEREIDAMNEGLPPLRSFVLPGGSRVNAEFHAARTICRRAERLLWRWPAKSRSRLEAIRYLNRLSDALFVWSRWANHVLGLPKYCGSRPRRVGDARDDAEYTSARGEQQDSVRRNF